MEIRAGFLIFFDGLESTQGLLRFAVGTVLKTQTATNLGLLRFGL